jgi:hypothetical protein
MVGCFSDAFSIDGVFCGKALSVALSLLDFGVRSLLIAPLATDEGGMAVIKLLIEKGVFFDPDLIFSQGQTPLSLESSDLYSSVFGLLKREEVESIIELNPDLSLYYISPETLSSRTVSAAIAAALQAKEVKCPILLDCSCGLNQSLLTPYEGLCTLKVGPGLDLECEDLIPYLAKHSH